MMTTLRELLTEIEIDIIENINKSGNIELNYDSDVDLLTWAELRLVGFAFYNNIISINLAATAIHKLTERAIEQNKPIFT